MSIISQIKKKKKERRKGRESQDAGWGKSEESFWRNCFLSQNLQVSRKDSDGEVGGKGTRLTLAVVRRRVSAG